MVSNDFMALAFGVGLWLIETQLAGAGASKYSGQISCAQSCTNDKNVQISATETTTPFIHHGTGMHLAPLILSICGHQFVLASRWKGMKSMDPISPAQRCFSMPNDGL